jgi:hypothetical protein
LVGSIAVARFKDITGQRFGRLVALHPTNKRRRGCVVWRCVCDCGKQIEASAWHLRGGATRSCGCLRRLDITGVRFGRLVALHPTDKRRGSSMVWRCVCDCGKKTEASTFNLRQGYTRSCGCLKADAHVKHGHARNGKKSATYRSWQSMRARCLNPNHPRYPDYGGRGIGCDAYSRFQTLLAEVGERLPGTTLDRIDPDGDYAPGNIRWATLLVQANNRRERAIPITDAEVFDSVRWTSKATDNRPSTF